MIEKDRIAIGFCRGDAFRADRTAGTLCIDDRNRHAEFFFKILCIQTCIIVCIAASLERDDQGNASCRPLAGIRSVLWRILHGILLGAAAGRKQRQHRSRKECCKSFLQFHGMVLLKNFFMEKEGLTPCSSSPDECASMRCR